MADHFEEVVNLRLHALETRVDDEAGAVKAHFQEQRLFIADSLSTQADKLRAEIGRVRDDLARLDQKVEAYQEINRLEFRRLEQKMDAHHDATHLVLQEILRRLPAPPA